MENIIILAVYLIGCICAYLLFRNKVRKNTGNWTIRDRSAGLLFSLFSWIGIFSIIIIKIISYDNDTPAKW